MEAERAPESSRCERRAESLATRAIYSRLIRTAHFHLHRDPLGYLWSPAALVNEAYIRLVSQYGKEWAARENIISLWSRIMRNVLIDNARAFRAAKRNGGSSESVINDCPTAAPRDVDLAITLRLVMESIRTEDPRQAEVLEMRFRDGFTVDETAAQLRVSRRTVEWILEAARCRFMRALV